VSVCDQLSINTIQEIINKLGHHQALRMIVEISSGLKEDSTH